MFLKNPWLVQDLFFNEVVVQVSLKINFFTDTCGGLYHSFNCYDILEFKKHLFFSIILTSCFNCHLNFALGKLRKMKYTCALRNLLLRLFLKLKSKQHGSVYLLQMTKNWQIHCALLVRRNHFKVWCISFGYFDW